MSPESPRSGSFRPELIGHVLRSLFATAIALAIGLCLVVGITPTATASDSKAAAKLDRIQARAAKITDRPAVLKELRKINKARVNHGLRPVALSKCLSAQVAQPWARHMARSGQFAHQNMSSIHGSCPRFGWAGENIAYGYSTVSSVMTAWMHSDGHRANLLRPQFSHVGLGIVKDSGGRKYWVQDFGG